MAIDNQLLSNTGFIQVKLYNWPVSELFQWRRAWLYLLLKSFGPDSIILSSDKYKVFLADKKKQKTQAQINRSLGLKKLHWCIMIIVLTVVLYMLLHSHQTRHNFHHHHHHKVELARLFHGAFLPSFNLHSYSIILFLLYQFRARGDHF